MAACNLVPRPVRNTMAPSTTAKLTGRISGVSPTDTATPGTVVAWRSELGGGGAQLADQYDRCSTSRHGGSSLGTNARRSYGETPPADDRSPRLKVFAVGIMLILAVTDR